MATKRKAKQVGNGNGTIYKSGPNTFRWQITLGWDHSTTPPKRISKSGTESNKTLARGAMTQALSDHSRKLIPLPDGITLEEYCDRWIKRQTNLRTNTIEAQRHELRHALNLIGNKKMQDVKLEHLKDVMFTLSQKIMTRGAYKNKPMSLRTLGKVRMHLRAVFTEAVIEKLITVNPTDGLKPPPTTKANHHKRIFEPGELQRFRLIGETLHKYGMCKLWVALFTTVSLGLRKSEAMGLVWDDIDLERKILKVRNTRTTDYAGNPKQSKPKTESSIRDIPLPPSLVQVLSAHQATVKTVVKRLPENYPVFATAKGQFIHPDNLRRSLMNVIEWSNPEAWGSKQIAVDKDDRPVFEAVINSGSALPQITVHDLRHTYATLALRRGVPVEVVSRILGHAHISITTDIYRHVSELEKRQHVPDLFD